MHLFNSRNRRDFNMFSHYGIWDEYTDCMGWQYWTAHRNKYAITFYHNCVTNFSRKTTENRLNSFVWNCFLRRTSISGIKGFIPKHQSSCWKNQWNPFSHHWKSVAVVFNIAKVFCLLFSLFFYQFGKWFIWATISNVVGLCICLNYNENNNLDFLFIFLQIQGFPSIWKIRSDF